MCDAEGHKGLLMELYPSLFIMCSFTMPYI